MHINSNVTLNYNSTVGLITKLVKQYIDSGMLEERFRVFDAEPVEYGLGYSRATVLAATKQNDGSSKAEEHGAFPPKVMATFQDTIIGGQWAVTLDRRRLNECVGDAAAAQEYAAELTESLYQGWITEKNKGVAGAAGEVIAKSDASGITVTLTEDQEEKFASTILMTIKAKVEDLKEGVKGSDYGNSFIGDSEIAAHDIVIVMSNDLAALLDVYGFARVFAPEYLRENRVRRVTSNKIAADTVLITDARNISARDKYEEFVDIRNSDGTINYFYNKYQYISAAIANDEGTYNGQVAYPYYVIKKTEA